jgi:hypothetical protein
VSGGKKGVKQERKKEVKIKAKGKQETEMQKKVPSLNLGKRKMQ